MWALISPYPRSTEIRLRIIGPLVLFTTGVLFFRLKMYLNLSGQELINQICIALAMGYFGWELARATVLFVQRKFPGLHRMRLRLIILVLSLIVLGHIGYIMRVFLHFLIDGLEWGWPTIFDYSDIMGVVMFYNTVIISLYEGGYIWKQWKTSLEDKEKALRSEWQAKYDLLKAQINPHFIFNSLNSLSSLITENPKQAEKFADEMSTVYRYLLRNNDSDLVTLSAEIHFIRSYCSLLTTRYGQGFQFSVDVPDEIANNYLLPSLTLQLLVENAVKHNNVLKEQPLKVTIRTEGDSSLCVENNMQKKKIIVKSNGVGLSNINDKFKLLNQAGIFIRRTNDTFSVFVPLIKNEVAV